MKLPNEVIDLKVRLWGQENIYANKLMCGHETLQTD